MEGGQWHGEFVDSLGLLGSSALLACWLSAWVHGCAGRHEHESANGDHMMSWINAGCSPKLTLVLSR